MYFVPLLPIEPSGKRITIHVNHLKYPIPEYHKALTTLQFMKQLGFTAGRRHKNEPYHIGRRIKS